MRVAVYSLEKTLYQGEVEKIIARTTTGEITILDNHVPLVSSLKGPNVEVVEQSGKKNLIPIVSGFLEVRPESNIVILASV